MYAFRFDERSINGSAWSHDQRYRAKRIDVRDMNNFSAPIVTYQHGYRHRHSQHQEQQQLTDVERLMTANSSICAENERRRRQHVAQLDDETYDAFASSTASSDWQRRFVSVSYVENAGFIARVADLKSLPTLSNYTWELFPQALALLWHDARYNVELALDACINVTNNNNEVYRLLVIMNANAINRSSGRTTLQRCRACRCAKRRAMWAPSCLLDSPSIAIAAVSVSATMIRSLIRVRSTTTTTTNRSTMPVYIYPSLSLIISLSSMNNVTKTFSDRSDARDRCMQRHSARPSRVECEQCARIRSRRSQGRLL